MSVEYNQELKVELIEKEVLSVELKTIDIIPGSNRYGLTIINNYTAISAPTINDDSDDDYEVGSTWVNISADKSYICVDATVGAAIWRQTDITTHVALYNHALLHLHSNKTILDNIQEALTSTLKTAYDDAVTKTHEHDNKATLDLIEEAFTSALKTAYDDAVDKAHLSSLIGTKTIDETDIADNKILQYDIASNTLKYVTGVGGLNNVVEDTTPQLGGNLDMNGHGIGGNTEAQIDDAVSKKHSHSNKATLDLIEEAFTSALKTAYDDAVDKAHLSSLIGTKTIDETDIADNKILQYDIASNTLKYVTGVGGLNNVVEDTTPQLGGNLDMNGHGIGGNTEAQIDDAVSKKHSHSNKTTLDLIEEAFTSALKTAYDSCVTKKHTHSNKTELDKVTDGDHDVISSGNPHSVTKSEIGLSNVTNNEQIPLAQKAVANGVATLGADSKIPNAQLPALAITETYTAVNETAQLALTVQEGDVCVRTDENKSYIALNADNVDMGDWQELLTPTDSVTSVNAKTGVVVLTTTDIAEGTNEYYTEAKVSANTDVTANTTARHSHANKTLLDTYSQTEVDIADAISKEHEHSNKTELDKITVGDHDVISSGNPHSVTKTEVGLSNVDNTSDANKLVSTAQQTALDLKQDNLPIADTTAIVKGSADATKLVRLEVDGLTASTTRVLTVQDKDYTIADNADLHAESHSIASHNDTTATGTQLNTLVGGGDTSLHVHDTYALDTDLSTHEADTTAIHGITDTSDLALKSGNVNQLADITSAGADIEDAVTKKHTQGSDTALGTQTQALDMGAYNINNVNALTVKAASCTVYNNTGASLAIGVVVYPTGNYDGYVTVAKCDNTDKDKMIGLGIVSSLIANNSEGKAVYCGIKGMDTSGFTGNEGESIYVQSDGTLDTVEPTSGSIQCMGVLVVKAVDGKIYVQPKGRRSTFATIDEHPIIRMGDDVGHKKISFHKYDNTEIGYIDENAIMKITSLTDGTYSTTIADLKDSVDKKHSQNTDTSLGTMSADINMNTHKLTGLSVPSSNGDSIRATTKITEANLEIAYDHSQVSSGNPHSVTPTELSLVIGTNVQAYDDALASISGLAYVSASFIKLTNTDTYAVRTITEVKTDLSLNNVSNVATDDTAYNATSWDGNSDATTKNAIRDKIETMDTAIGLNTTKNTNVSTQLSEGTRNATTYGITSDGGADDIVLPEADTTNAGLLGADKWDEIVANTAAKHTQNTDTSLGAQSADLNMNTHKITGVVNPVADQDAETKKHVADTYATIAVANKTTIGITIDAQSSVIDTGYKGFIRIPYACTITKVSLLGNKSGSIVIDIWKCSYANYDAGATHPVDGDSITASAPPTITTTTKSEDSTLTAWTTSITAGDIIAFNVDSCTDIEKVTLILEVTKT